MRIWLFSGLALSFKSRDGKNTRGFEYPTRRKLVWRINLGAGLSSGMGMSKNCRFGSGMGVRVPAPNPYPSSYTHTHTYI